VMSRIKVGPLYRFPLEPARLFGVTLVSPRLICLRQF
jgi:hypothetical protein